MYFTILLITIFIFLNNLGYSIYEFQNNNKFACICTIILNIFMLIFVNYSTFNFG